MRGLARWCLALALAAVASASPAPDASLARGESSRDASSSSAPRYFRGWGPGYDADDGPLAALAAARRAASSRAPDEDAEALALADEEMNPESNARARVVTPAAQASRRAALGRLMTADDAAVPSDLLGPRLPMPELDAAGTPLTAEEYFRRPRRPPVGTPARGGLRSPPANTLRWRDASRRAVEDAIRRLQFPPDCDRAAILAVPLEMCPLGCRLHIFLQRALATSVAMGRTLVPLPPYDRGFEHVFQPVTNCSLREDALGPTASPSRRRLARALATLSDVLLASGAPHEKLHPLLETKALVYKIWPAEDARKKNGGDVEEDAREAELRETYLKKRPLRDPDTVAAVWFDRVRDLLEEQGAKRSVMDDWDAKAASAEWRDAAKALAEALTGGGEGVADKTADLSSGEEGGGSVVACSNGRCDHAWGARGACVRPEGCARDGDDAQMPEALWAAARDGFFLEPERDLSGTERDLNDAGGDDDDDDDAEEEAGDAGDEAGDAGDEAGDGPPPPRVAASAQSSLRFAPTAADLAALERGTTASAWARVGRATLDRLTSSAEAVLPLPGYEYELERRRDRGGVATTDDDASSKTTNDGSPFGVPANPPRVPGGFGCNDWPSACQPHFAAHAMLTSWMVSRPTRDVAAFVVEDAAGRTAVKEAAVNEEEEEEAAIHIPSSLKEEGEGEDGGNRTARTPPPGFHNLHRLALGGPTAVLQVRRSDKRGEDPFYVLNGGYRDLDVFVSSLRRVAALTGTCFENILLMTDARHVVQAMRRKHARGEITVCGKKPALAYGASLVSDDEQLAPVFGDALAEGPRSEGEAARRRAANREREFVAELWLAARFGDFVVGDATSNVFLMTLELIAARKRVADLPRLVEWKDEHEEEEEARGGRERGGHPNASERGPEVSERLRRCPSNDPELGACAWVSGLGLSFQIGWHSVLLNDPWVNGVPRVVEWGNRVGEAEVERRASAEEGRGRDGEGG